MAGLGALPVFYPQSRGSDSSTSDHSVKLIDVLEFLEEILVLGADRRALEMVRTLKDESPSAVVLGLGPRTWENVRGGATANDHMALKKKSKNEASDSDDDLTVGFLFPRRPRIVESGDRKLLPSAFLSLQSARGPSSIEDHEGQLTPGSGPKHHLRQGRDKPPSCDLGLPLVLDHSPKARDVPSRAAASFHLGCFAQPPNSEAPKMALVDRGFPRRRAPSAPSCWSSRGSRSTK
eukprot:TRINITY_DN34351_c0_g2_i1.p1 TRINITY_DN34351_c0_g2~~TRINITY_DN34351_c0_g2_i1.p1  ORF type:complete len:235 (-),score=31.49 TRINITY_DN34351_c0_g2_i1:54-758(-)